MTQWGLNRAKRAAISRSQVAREARPIGLFVGGRYAFNRGQDPTQCPYVLGTTNWSLWYLGWVVAFKEKFYGDQIA